MSIIALVVVLILVGLAFWAINMLAPAFGIPQPIVTVLYVLLVIIVVVWLLGEVGLMGGGAGGPILRLR